MAAAAAAAVGFRSPTTLLLPATKQHAFLTRLVTCLPNPLYKRLSLALRARQRLNPNAFQQRIEKVLSEAGAHHLTSTLKAFLPEIPVQSLEQARLEVDLLRVRRDFFPAATSLDDERFPTLDAFVAQLPSARLAPSILKCIAKKTAWLEKKRQSRLEACLCPVEYDIACNYLIRIASFLGEARSSTYLYGFFKYILEIQPDHIQPILESATGPILDADDADLSNLTTRQRLDRFLFRLASSLPDQTYFTVAKAIFQLQTRREERAEAEQTLYTPTDLRVYQQKIRKALGDRRWYELSEDFMRFAPVLEIEALETVRTRFTRVESYRLETSAGEIVSDPATAANEFYHKEEFRHKIFVNNLPYEVTLEDIRKSFDGFGKVIAVEFYKERVVKRPLNLSHANAPVSKPLNLDEDLDESEPEADETINASTDPDEDAVVVDEPRPRGKWARKKSRLKPRPIPDSNLYAAVYFDSQQSVEKALDTSIRVFGVAMEDKIVHDAQCKTVFRQCRTSLPPSALFISNLPFEVCGYSVETYLHEHLLSSESFPEIQSCIQTDFINIARGSLIMQFKDHTDAMAAYQSLVGKSVQGRPLKIGWLVDYDQKLMMIAENRKQLAESNQETTFDFSQFSEIPSTAPSP